MSSGKENIGLCRLCGKEKQLQKNHIISKMFFNEIKRNSPTKKCDILEIQIRHNKMALSHIFYAVTAKNFLVAMNAISQRQFIKT